MKRLPTSDIAPSEIALKNIYRNSSVLHHPVIDRNRLQFRIDFFKYGRVFFGCYACSDGGQTIIQSRQATFKLSQNRLCCEDKNATVPQIVSTGNVFDSRFKIWFLYEFVDGKEGLSKA